jgi:hypothetical protein
LKKEIWTPKPTEIYVEIFNNNPQIFVKQEMEFESKEIDKRKMGFYNDESSDEG